VNHYLLYSSVPARTNTTTQATDQFAEVQYQRNFLSSVVARIDFSPILKITSDSISNFQDGIRTVLPQYEAQGMTAIEVSQKIVGGIPREETVQFPFPRHIFRREDGAYSLSLEFNALWLECSRYTTYEAFMEIFVQAYQLLTNNYAPINVTRLGLRYVNFITPGKGNPLDWSNLIEPTLTHFLDTVVEDKTKLSRALTRAFYVEEDYVISVAYGFFNSQFPAKIAEKEFLLDFDCHTKVVEQQDVISQLNNYHSQIQRLFEKCVLPNLKTLMNQT
jgi:uncharacterized protein (TIGR04255 family)